MKKRPPIGKPTGGLVLGTVAQRDARPRSAEPRKPVVLAEVESGAVDRLRTGSDELDRVLGGGLVPGSVVLIGGSPGIGKSTLMSAALASIQSAGGRSLYVSGEESAAQVKLRAERLGPHALGVPVLAETSLEVVLASLEQERPQACVIDSVQTLWSAELTGAPGSVGQVQEVAAALERFARERGCAMILVGHVTKEGTLAGPRVLEHAVDCVLQFEGERERSFRTLRALKNRFGSTNEIGVFEMRAGGLDEVADPSERFLRDAEPVPGSCVLCAMEGTRPLLVEVQALVAPTDVVPPRRVANGIDRNRLSMILAVLARHGGPSLGSADVFVNVAGGVRIEEPGRGPRGGARRRVRRAGRTALGQRGAVRVLRRDRPHRRAALRGPRRPAAGGGGAVRPRADRAPGALCGRRAAARPARPSPCLCRPSRRRSQRRSGAAPKTAARPAPSARSRQAGSSGRPPALVPNMTWCGAAFRMAPRFARGFPARPR